MITKREIDDVLEKAIGIGDDFSVTLCSDSFDFLPTGEEDRAGSLTLIELDQSHHVSALHNEISMSLKQGKMRYRSDRVDEDSGLNICGLLDSNGNLQLDVCLVRNSADDLIEPTIRVAEEVTKSKEILSNQSQFTRRGL